MYGCPFYSNLLNSNLLPSRTNSPTFCHLSLLFYIWQDLFPSSPFDLHASLSLWGFLPLFFHECPSNCYNWALIKLAACFPRKRLEWVGPGMFTRLHVHLPSMFINYGVHPQQKAFFGNTHCCNSTINPKGYHQQTFSHANTYSLKFQGWLTNAQPNNWLYQQDWVP